MEIATVPVPPEAETSRFVEADGIRVHLNDVGEGPPLIFCEGQGPGTSAWVVYHRVLPWLAGRHRCILVDQPGYGRSDAVVVRGESRSTMYARTVRGVMDALGLPRAVVVDMSFGAQTGQVMAVDHPDRVEALVLHAAGMGGPTLFGTKPMEGIAAMADAFASPSLATMRRMMDAFLHDGHRYTDAELMLQERLAAWLARPDQEKARRASERVTRDLTASLGKIRAPILQIHGRHDKVMSCESALMLFNHLPDARFVMLQNCGHWIPFERPKDFAEVVLSFLSNLEGAGP
jgi:2-hydroxy-6-oxonona-2,4-dienedioate hydrolase